MQLYVINLPERIDRRRHVEAALAATSLQYEFFPAIKGKDALDHYFNGVNYRSYLLETGHSPSHGEIGCYASHMSLWRKCVALGTSIGILEDDFQPGINLSAALDFAAKRIDACGFIRLEPVEKRWNKKPGLAPVIAESTDRFKLWYQRMPSVRLTAYCISPACAQAFLHHSQILSAPADHMTRRCWVHKQAMYALEPPAVILSDEAKHSSIDGRRKSPARHLISPVRLAYRYMERRRARLHSARQLTDLKNTGPVTK